MWIVRSLEREGMPAFSRKRPIQGESMIANVLTEKPIASSSMAQMVREELWRDESEHKEVLRKIGELSDLSQKLTIRIARHKDWLKANGG